MNATIEAVKDEVANKHNYRSWEQLNYTFFCNWAAAKGSDMGIVRQQYKEFENEVAELYHSRKCEEAGRELPDRERMEKIAKEYSLSINKQGNQYDGSRTASYLDNITGLSEMKQIASKLLASLQSEIDGWKWANTKLRDDLPSEYKIRVHAVEKYPHSPITCHDFFLEGGKYLSELALPIIAKWKEKAECNELTRLNQRQEITELKAEIEKLSKPNSGGHDVSEFYKD